jgi:hypothetical protein
MSRTYDHEAADKYIAQQTAAHVADLTQAAINGDAATLDMIGQAVAELNDAKWNALLSQSAAGVNALQAFITETIEAEAGKRAEADAGRVAPLARRSSTIAHRAEELAWNRLQAGQLEYS